MAVSLGWGQGRLVERGWEPCARVCVCCGGLGRGERVQESIFFRAWATRGGQWQASCATGKSIRTAVSTQLPGAGVGTEK